MFGRLSAFCFRHRLVVVAVWVVAIAGGVFASGPVFKALSDDNNRVSLESTRGWDALDGPDSDSGQVVAVVDRVDPAAARTRSAVAATAAELRREPGVRSVDDPYPAGRTVPALVSTDRRAVLLVVHLVPGLDDENASGPDEDAVVDAVSAKVRTLADAVAPAGGTSADDVTVQVGGDALLGREINEQVGQDLSRTEYISLPLTLLFMIVVFGGFLAASLPVIGAIASVGAAMLGLWGFSTFSALDSNTLTVSTLLGLGLSIDYGLLMVSRYREELGALLAAVGDAKGTGTTPVRVGRPVPVKALREEAIRRAGATAGHTIAFSALTVAAALGGLVAISLPFMQAVGSAGVSIAIVTMLSATTLVPALLALIGRRIRPAKLKLGADGQRVDPTDGGLFARLAARVQRRPALVLVGTLGVLLVAAAPLLSLRLTDPGLGGIPTSIESRAVIDVLDGRFGRQEEPDITVVARLTPAALDRWAAGHADDTGIATVGRAEQVRPGLSRIDIKVTGDPQGGDARATVNQLRDDRPPGGRSWVTGQSALFADQLALLTADLPRALAITVVAMLVLLFALTGSVILPIKALLMNLVSMGATFGAMVAVFQWGWLSGPLDTLTNPGLDPFVLTIVFAFAFGLSMDYETFLLARIKEAHDGGLRNGSASNSRAVRFGLQHSGRIITSAAVAMIIVFSCFIAGKIGTVEQIGVGLVVAVFVDATLVRCLLVPATMTLLGRVNWWAPGPLRRLHDRFGFREGPAVPDVRDEPSDTSRGPLIPAG